MPTTELIDLITQFRAVMFDHFPYISHYVYSLNPVPSNKVPTMAVDTTGNMYYNPEWSESLTLEQGGYVVLHEAWHLILRHCHRAKELFGHSPTPQQQYDFNIAADIIVWESMISVADMAPPDGVTLPKAQAKWPAIQPNMTLAELYTIIHNDREEGKDDGKGEPGKKNGKDGGKEDGNGKGDGDGEEKAERPDGTGTPSREEPRDNSTEPSRDRGDSGDSEGSPEDGEGSGQTTEGSGDQEVDDHGFPNVSTGSSADGIRRDFEDQGNDAWESYIEDKLLEECEKAIDVLENTDPNWHPSRGNIPGRLKRVIKQKLHPSVNPWSELRDAIAKAIASYGGIVQPTFLVRNRRQSCLQPNVVIAGEKRYQPKVAVIMDTSGSMTRMCLAKAAAICQQGTRSVGSYRLVCWDARLQLDVEVKRQFKDWPAPGGGGTCMTSAIEYVFDNPGSFGKPDVVICVTDGGTSWPREMPKGKKLVIALTQDSKTPPEYAKTVRVPDPGKTTPERYE
jgi:predicted metal-dependent peptidase